MFNNVALLTAFVLLVCVRTNLSVLHAACSTTVLFLPLLLPFLTSLINMHKE